MIKPLISVIIPTYNRRPFLESVSVPSVLRQTYSNFELIIVDDYSTDDTANYVRSLIKKDVRVKYIKNFRTKGVSGARNSGVLISKGRYISFLDDDDEWIPDHLANLLYYLEKYPKVIDIISAAQVLINKNSGQSICYNLSQYKNYSGYFLEEAYIFDANPFELALEMFLFNDCAMLAKREIFDHVLYPEDLYMCEDSFFVLNVAYLGYKVAFLPKIHLYYYIHDRNTSNVSHNKTSSKYIYLAKGQIEFYKKCLRSFKLKPYQKRKILKRLSDCYCWQLAYNGYLPLGQMEDFLTYFKKGLKIDLLDLKKWKTFLKYFVLTKISLFKQNFSIKKGF